MIKILVKLDLIEIVLTDSPGMIGALWDEGNPQHPEGSSVQFQVLSSVRPRPMLFLNATTNCVTNTPDYAMSGSKLQVNQTKFQ